MKVLNCEIDVPNLNGRRKDNIRWKSHGINVLIKSSHKHVYLAFRTVAYCRLGKIQTSCKAFLCAWWYIKKSWKMYVKESFSAWFLYLKFKYSNDNSLLFEELHDTLIITRTKRLQIVQYRGKGFRVILFKTEFAKMRKCIEHKTEEITKIKRWSKMFNLPSYPYGICGLT